ncbi:MAG: EAL domain-containing protein [Burkholderiales bacterium]|nr:EAL domain-containing protein [Burkholderiales bacterium]
MIGRPGRLAGLVAAVLLLTMGSSLMLLGLGARQALSVAETRRNQDRASAWAERLSALPAQSPAADPASARAQALARLFDDSDALLVRLQPTDGSGPPQTWQRPEAAMRAPRWFRALLPIDAAPGWAGLPRDGIAAATLQLLDRRAAAQDALWDLCRDFAAWALALVVTLTAAVWAAARAWQQAYAPVLAQAQALEQGRLVEVDVPAPAELRLLAHSLNRAVRRLRGVFAQQAGQVALLERQAQLDSVTGLPLRRGFLGLLQRRVAAPGGPGTALLLLQVPQLESLNQRLGHEATDRLLSAIADLLLTYVDRVPGAFAGRLNGSDLALCLPVSGLAAETAESLRTALAAAPALRNAGTEVLIAGVDGLTQTSPSAALAAADAALARAQADDRIAIDTQGDLVGAAAGARAWREQIAAALAEGRAQLGEFPVLDRAGRLIHLECPLRVQLSAGGPFEAARRWLALARRSRLLPQVDLVALDLALAACHGDGRPRAVHAALASLAAPEFIAEVGQRLAASPRAAGLLSIECLQGANGTDAALLARAAAAWRPWGVKVGVEHLSGSPQQLPALQNAGVDYVKVDARHLRGVAADAALRGYAQSLAALIHGLGLAALAEGIDDARDLAALWPLGFDGATGPALAAGAPP